MLGAQTVNGDVKIVDIIRGILNLLPASWRGRYWRLLGCAVLVAGGETLTLGLIALFASSITNPDAVFTSGLFVKAVDYLPQLAALDAKLLLMWLGIVVVVVVALKNLCRTITQYFQTKFMWSIACHVKEKMLGRIMHMPYQWVLKQNSADLANSVVWSGSSGMLLGSLFLAASEIVLVCMMLTALIVANPTVVLGAIAFLGIPSFFLVRALRARIDSIGDTIAEYRKQSHRSLMAALNGLKEVKVYGKERSLLGWYTDVISWDPLLVSRQEVYTSAPGLILEVFGFLLLCLASILMYFYFDDSSARVTGTISLLAVSAWRGLPAVARIVSCLTMMRTQLPYVKRSLELLDELEAAHPGDERVERGSLSIDHSLEFRDIRYEYEPGCGDTLKGLSFEAVKGEALGIVGESGAGKSTVLDIMIGLLTPSAGEILVDGEPAEMENRWKWSPSFGYVSQSPHIFDATLAENVAFGKQEGGLDMQRIEDACRQAAVVDFLPKLENGYETELGERGVRLSGGQRQRICIARALYNTPEILIFDEATSSLDRKSEKQIQETIVSLKGAVTMVVVAHRLSSVEMCDRLLWIEHGKVRECGPTSEVLPRYRAYLAQSGGSSDQK